MKHTLPVLLLLILCTPARGADYSKDPVLMVHGYFLPDFATWLSIEGKLIDDGWPSEFLFGQTFDSVVGCNPKHAEAIAASVEMIREVTGRDKVDLLSHSMGALDRRYYIKYLCGYKYVKDVVMLAGANHGSIVACLDPLSCGAEQMCIGVGGDAWTGNAFLADLNACDETPGEDLTYTSIWTEFDEIIIPATGAILPGALNHELDTFAEHGSILLNNEAYQWVKVGLNGGGSNDVGPTGEEPCVTVCEDPFDPVDASLEIIEGTWDVVDATPDVVEGIAEIVELPPDHGPGEDLWKSHPETIEADEGPNPAEVVGDGFIGDGSDAPVDVTGPTGPIHYLPPTRSGGCSAGAVPVSGRWWLLLLTLAAGVRRRRG